MNTDVSIESVVQQYLDNVAEFLTNAPVQRRDTLIRELREHIRDSIDARTSGRAATLQDAYAALSEMDSPETYADKLPTEAEEPKPNVKLIALSLLCSGLQIVGLLAVIAGIPVVAAIAGFAAVANFFVIWSNSRTLPWVVRLSAVAAICGLALITVEVLRAL